MPRNSTFGVFIAGTVESSLSGILTVIVGVLVAVWAAKFVQRKNGGLVLILLSIIMLLVGGGLFPPVFGVAAGFIGTRINPINESTKHMGA